MPSAEPYRAWATFTFTAQSGRVNECDLFIATPGGIYLVELKGHPGTVVNSGSTWRFRADGRVRTLHNPLHLTDLKAKELKGQLDWAARKLGITERIPRIEAAVYLSSPGLRSELDDVQRLRVYGNDGEQTGLPGIWADLLSRPPQSDRQRVTPMFSRDVLPRLMAKIGISPSQAHLQFGDGWTLEPRALDAGPTWEDRLARREDIVREEGRVRIYLVEKQATAESRQSVSRAALREYHVLQGINHRGIAQALDIREHQGGPAILFRHDHRDLRLDAFLGVHGESLTPEVRLDLVRQLGEAVRYAHNRSLYHRALAARSVYVSAKEDGSHPVLRITDWQTAARDFDTTSSLRSIAKSTLTDQHVEDAAQVYLAPEFEGHYVDPVDLDMFGLGAVSYLILTGTPPASSRAALIERLSADGGLHPYAIADGITDALDQLIYRATRTDVGDRLAPVETFLDGLDRVEQEATAAEGAGAGPEGSWAGADPLTVVPGQAVDGDAAGAWVVDRVLGTGATARVLLLARTTEDDDGAARRELRVLKVALDQEKVARLQAEAEVLRQVGGGAVVRLLGEPRQLGPRTVLDLEYAGAQSLGTLLRNEGRLTYHQLGEFGSDLFKALDQLAGHAVRHRDVKPDNFGVFQRADRRWELKLFDFSLAGVSDRDVKAGTRGYLDPFLGTARRPDFDDHAERYAAAVTLHEMASGMRPEWGDGATDPRTTTDEVPYLAADLFEPALRDGLTAFFSRALHRDIACRFDTLRQMRDAWQEIFRAADQSAPATTQATVGSGVAADVDGRLAVGTAAEALVAARDAAAEAAELGTPLDAAGLSPRAVSVAGEFHATTVGELLDVPLYQIAKARGAGAIVRKELNRRHKQWTTALRRPGTTGTAGGAPPPQEGAGHTAGERLRIDDLVTRLTPAPGRKGSSKALVIRLTLGLPDSEGAETTAVGTWLTQVDIARKLGLTQPSVSRHHLIAIREWAAAGWLADVRDELVAIVATSGRVMTAEELAAALRARRGAADQAPELALAKAMSVVRAAVEAETWQGNEQPADYEPRLAILRRGRQVLVVMESLPGTDDPSPRELADYALALGHRAEEIAGTEPLSGRTTVIRDLRAVTAPAGMAPLADTRLVELAAAVSQWAVASPRLELYPRQLDLARALRISQAAAGVRPERGISVDELLARVRSRFPDLDAYQPSPTHVQLEEALQEAGFPLLYDVDTGRFSPRHPPGRHWTSSTGTATSGLPGAVITDRAPHEHLAANLAAAVEQGGFLALTLNLRHLSGAARALAAAYPVVPIDVGAMFLAEFRALATEHGTGWDKVLRADERLTRSGQMPAGLRSYVSRVWNRLETKLLAEAAAPGTVLLLHGAGLLAHYFDEGGHDVLSRLQNMARRPDSTPHGLWLLCPAENRRGTPNLDGRIVEVIGGSEWVTLDGSFLDGLRGQSSVA